MLRCANICSHERFLRHHLTLDDRECVVWLFGEDAMAFAIGLTSARMPMGFDRRFDSEIVQFFSRPKLCNQPARLFPATRPSLGRPLRIPKLRNHFGIRTPCAADMLVALEHALAKQSQSLLKPSLLGRYLACQD
jgi:hypothetical protein